MTDTSLTKDLDDLRVFLRRRLGLKGATLSAQLSRAKADLPRAMQPRVQRVRQTEELLEHPKLRMRIPPEQTREDLRALKDWARHVDPGHRRMTQALGVLAVILFNTLVIAALVLAVLRWRGLA